MSLGFNSNNTKLNNFLKEQQGKPVTDEVKARALELAKQTKGGGKQTGLKDVSQAEVKDINSYLKTDILKTVNSLGKAAGKIDLGLDGKPEAVQSFKEKFANYNKLKNWNPDFLANSVSKQKELNETADKIGKRYNVPPAFLLAAFAIETDPSDHDIMSKERENYLQEGLKDDYLDHENLEDEIPPKYLDYDDYDESGEFPGRRGLPEFPVSGFLVGGIDNENWLKGLPFKKGKDYEIMEEINEQGKIVEAPNFKDGKTCVNAFMMVFAREAAGFSERAQTENWKNFDADAPFVLARLAYNAGPNSKGFKKALDFYQNGNGKTLPHVQKGTNVEKNLEHALKILETLKIKDGLQSSPKSN
jgi:hypothetical protein